MSPSVIITCEHAGPERPHWVEAPPPGGMLGTHRAFDAGALELAAALASELHAPMFVAMTSRLLVDLNRSPGMPGVLGAWGERLDAAGRARLMAEVHAPHWAAVRSAVAREIAADQRVVHIGAHTFTPVLRGVRRRCDIGLLDDPGRAPEVALSEAWRARLPRRYITRRNQPYKGTSDGLTTALRREFGPAVYVGIELELNQRLYRRSAVAWANACAAAARACRDAISAWG